MDMAVQVLLTARNIFIANLAISDLLLCLFTMPLAMMDIITKFWVLGPRMVGMNLNYQNAQVKNIRSLPASCLVVFKPPASSSPPSPS